MELLVGGGRLGLGCMSVSGQYDSGTPLPAEESLAFFQGAHNAGYTHFDTAEVYHSGPFGQPPGTDAVFNEAQLGAFFRTIPRSSFTVGTKYAPWLHDWNADYPTVKAALLRSLSRLGLGYVDIYYTHRVPSREYAVAFMHTCRRLVHEGLIRAVGLSEVSTEWLVAAHAVHPVRCVQQEWSLLSRGIEDGLVPACVRLGVAIVAYSPLARNLLSGPADRPTDMRRRLVPRFSEDNFAQNQRMVTKIEKLAADKGCTTAQLSMGWLLQRASDMGVECIPIPGTKRLPHALDNMASAQLRLASGDMESLEQIALLVAGAREGDGYLAGAFEGGTKKAEFASALSQIAEVKRLNPGNLACKHFDVAYFNSLDDGLKARMIQCARSGFENPDSGVGAYAMQPDDYTALSPFMDPLIREYHKASPDAVHVNDWTVSGTFDLAELGLPALSMRVRVGRNLKSFPLPGAMSKQERCELEDTMVSAFEKLMAMPEYGGRYNSITPGHPCFVNHEMYNKLVKEHIMFKDMSKDPYLLSAGIAKDWPHGRGCYVSADKEFIVWVGEEDHLRVMCMKKGAILNQVFDRLEKALQIVSGIEGIEFACSESYGLVTSCPTNLGTGMRASVHVPLPNLTSDGTDNRAKAVALPLGLSVRGIGGEHTAIGADGTVDISPSARLFIREGEIIEALYKGLQALMLEESRSKL
eukprot:TRINITY_DN2877_c0_g1_i12.p1 TRINITY_DN2877_c0_g1~~TRINITY_DN2877_c0_g1_i12.p1  ORF type:complete len:696 (-),score=147.53 TRINITY_DN2877_c0_g1_i12:279-2366(-)